ncbi:helix-turn-helix transcriptional regulator [Tsuneonella sp. YG55]|uniref:Helix-turn-helix transcriptional regulator n=1 Tax=Tsuneonella litorea TaxID=2976475 RepID=A0A9X3AKY8_9SPHN|nr:helix-turn-helix transcriptional regulator [Tsuneonella litorea]MCT2558979.1 helix-turn-helix transcriptional regulator [Tsuneonella litorea]
MGVIWARMRVPNLGETDLLVPLHDGLFEQPMWQTFLSRLRRVSGTDYAALIIGASPDGDPTRLTLSNGVLPEDVTSVLAHWPGGEGRLFAAMREGRVHSLEELVQGRPELAAMRGSRASGFAAMRLVDPGGIEAVLLLAGAARIGPDVANLLVALSPHLRVAQRTFAAIERERARSEVNAEAISRMNFGWIALDARCRIVDCDAQAERFLQRSGVLRRAHYDRLTPTAAEVDRLLTAHVRECAANPRIGPRAVNLSRDPWTDILVAPLRIDSLAGRTNAVAAVYLRGDRSSRADRQDQLVGLFGLTPSEARLAWALSQGMSIAEGAATCGLTVETARNYSKKIYAKTGARGQVDLVRHILTGVLALA